MNAEHGEVWRSQFFTEIADQPARQRLGDGRSAKAYSFRRDHS
jgi:hypothetical protein